MDDLSNLEEKNVFFIKVYLDLYYYFVTVILYYLKSGLFPVI